MSNHLEVSGQGAVEATPDRAVLRLGVEVSGDSVAEVLGACSERVAALLGALDGLGVQRSEVTTTSVDLGALWDPQTGQPSGQQASQQLAVRLTQTEQVGALTNAAAAAAGDGFRMHGLSWLVSNPAALLARAREAAFEDAEIKARQLAALAGRDLGEVIRIREGGGGGFPNPRFALQAQAGDLPTESGLQEISATLTVRWLLA